MYPRTYSAPPSWPSSHNLHLQNAFLTSLIPQAIMKTLKAVHPENCRLLQWCLSPWVGVAWLTLGSRGQRPFQQPVQLSLAPEPTLHSGNAWHGREANVSNTQEFGAVRPSVFLGLLWQHSFANYILELWWIDKGKYILTSWAPWTGIWSNASST